MVKLSVIIPTRNRSIVLRDALASITQQTINQDLFEVIVIDNGSLDNTKEVVEDFKSTLKNLSYIYAPEPGLHTGRHVGLKAAKSEILVYADDDIIAFPTWLEGIFESMKDPDVVLVGGKNLPKYEIEPPFWIREKWYKLWPEGHVVPELSLIDLGDKVKEISTPDYVYGCNYAIRKKIVLETKGFHPDGMPIERIEYRGDGEYFVNNYIVNHKYKIVYNPKASVYHVTPKSRLTLDYFKKRAFCLGVEWSYTDLRNGLRPRIKEELFPIKNFFKNIRYLYRKFKKMQKTEIEREIEKSLEIGYHYHQYMYHNHTEVRDWVHKENYME